MLKVQFLISDSGDILGFDILGHSGYSQHGTDIVCAAVSSAAYMTLNTISDVMHADVEVEINEKSGHMSVDLNKKDVAMCSDILKGFKIHLLLLEEIYPENIKVSYVEV